MNIKNYTFELHKKAFRELYSKRFQYELPVSVLSFLLQATTYIFICFYALKEVFEIGSIIKYIGFIQRLINAIIDIFNVTGTIKYNTPFIEDYLSYFDITHKMYSCTLPVEKHTFYDGGDIDYEIEFRNVSFKYPASESYALRNVSIKICYSERLAVVGMNGSGKTTFIKLLCRLYDPTEGEILLNGINIKKYDYDEYMSIFSVVFQDFKLFSFSLGQNVAASVDYDKTRVDSCIREAGFGDRLDTMPDGVETYLYKDFEEKGVEISGGEAQKIALARALSLSRTVKMEPDIYFNHGQKAQNSTMMQL